MMLLGKSAHGAEAEVFMVARRIDKPKKTILLALEPTGETTMAHIHDGVALPWQLAFARCRIMGIVTLKLMTDMEMALNFSKRIKQLSISLVVFREIRPFKCLSICSLAVQALGKAFTVLSPALSDLVSLKDETSGGDSTIEHISIKCVVGMHMMCSAFRQFTNRRLDQCHMLLCCFPYLIRWQKEEEGLGRPARRPLRPQGGAACATRTWTAQSATSTASGRIGKGWCYSCRGSLLF